MGSDEQQADASLKVPPYAPSQSEQDQSDTGRPVRRPGVIHHWANLDACSWRHTQNMRPKRLAPVPALNPPFRRRPHSERNGPNCSIRGARQPLASVKLKYPGRPPVSRPGISTPLLQNNARISAAGTGALIFPRLPAIPTGISLEQRTSPKRP